MADFTRDIDINNLWNTIVKEAALETEKTPLIAEFYRRNILQHRSFESSLTYILAEKLADSAASINQWAEFISGIMDSAPEVIGAAKKDLICQLKSNASIKDHYTPLLYFGGYHALQCYRVAHYCWHHDQCAIANYIQGKSVSLFGVDIHPAAVIGKGIFIDHAVAIVVGETAVVEDNVTLFQSVTLGGTGKGKGDRHPKIRKGAFVGSGAIILGNIEVGEKAKVAAGAVVAKPVPPGATVVGSLAKTLS